MATTTPTTSLAEPAEAGVDLDRRRVHAALLSPVRARELLESIPAELDDRRVVDRDHVHWGLVAVLELPARAALGRAVDCTRMVSGLFSSHEHASMCEDERDVPAPGICP